MFRSLGKRLRARLIHDWRLAWRFWSVRLSAIGAALSAAWAALPPDTRALLPGAQWIGLVLFALVALARILRQGGTNG